MKNRYYQEEALTSIKSNYEKGELNQLLVMVTGSGKSRVFCQVPKLLGLNKTLILVRGDELVKQAVKNWSSINPDTTVSIEKAAEVSTDTDCVVASIPSLRGSRLQDFTLKYSPDCLIYDECHHILSDGSINILKAFNVVGERKSKSLLLGVTATPVRADRRSCKQILPCISYEYSLMRGLKDGFTSPIKAYKIETEVNISDVKVQSTGEFNITELDKKINIEKRHQLITDSWVELGGLESKTIAFYSSRDTAKTAVKYFKDKGASSFYIDGETPQIERDIAIESLGTTKGTVICNVFVLNEGFDSPNADFIVLGSPTLSGVTFSQRIGRGTRPVEGKTLKVLEARDSIPGCTCSTLLGLPSNFDLEGQDLLSIKEKLDTLATTYPQGFIGVKESKVSNMKELEQYIIEVPLLAPTDLLGPLAGVTHYSWCINDTEALLSGDLDSSESFILSIPHSYRDGVFIASSYYLVTLHGFSWKVSRHISNEYRANIEKELYFSTEFWKKSVLRKKLAAANYTKFESKDLNLPLKDVITKVDAVVKVNQSYALNIIDLSAPWRNRKPTAPQLRFAKKLGIPLTGNETMGRLSLLIDNVKRMSKK